MSDTSIPEEHRGHVFTEALPAEDPVLYGHATIEPKGAFEARTYQSFRLTYTTGRYGLDDTGSIKIVFRFTADGGDLQTDTPSAPNYVTAKSSNGVPLRVFYTSYGFHRPWYQALTIMVQKGYLREGDTIDVILGDRSEGSPGLLLQSMCESDFMYKVMADVCATGHYAPVENSPTIAITPGKAALWKAILPTLRRPGERFHFGFKGEDAWGNPSDRIAGTYLLSSSKPVVGLPDTVTLDDGERSALVEGLHCTKEGEVSITVSDENGQELACSNPLIIHDGAYSGYWGDMHGQSGESVGINTAREYFHFARNLAFLDSTSHQANDFQVNNAFWTYLNELTAQYQEDGRFVTFPGYEWSGNTGVGGDRNVYFRHEGRQIHRSSHALLPDRSDIDTDAPDTNTLFEMLEGEDCVIYAHIGGRPADVAFAHDGRLETAMEIHSAWGTFEWLMEDCFRLGYRVGVVANSDGHKGRPGASHPGASEFGAYGGLTCFLAEELTRDAYFNCLRSRHHYATTGNRLYMKVEARAASPFRFFPRDPALFPETRSEPRDRLMMGDIAENSETEVTLDIEVSGASPIERIDVLNALEEIQTVRGFEESALGDRIRVLWRGAAVKGRGARADWICRAELSGARIARFSEVNLWNPDRPVVRESERAVAWQAVTAGNFGAVDLWLEDISGNASLTVTTNHGTFSSPLSEIGLEDRVFDAGGLDLQLKLFRLPDENTTRKISTSVTVPLKEKGDNPFWIRVTTEDGYQAWSSPIYLSLGA